MSYIYYIDVNTEQKNYIAVQVMSFIELFFCGSGGLVIGGLFIFHGPHGWNWQFCQRSNRALVYSFFNCKKRKRRIST